MREAMTRRLKRLAVSPEFLVEMSKSGEIHARVVDHALPPDAKCVDVIADIAGQLIYLVIESAEYDEVDDAPIPEMALPVFERIRSLPLEVA